PLPPAVIDGCDPGDYLPAGPDAGGFQTLLSEVQMTLHASPVNQRREALGLPVINSLWIWGGGVAPEVHARSIPALFADDAQLCGYWNSAAGVAAPWPGSLDRCLERGGTGFVAATPDEVASAEAGADALTGYLRDLRSMVRNGGIRALTLLFRDGLTATVLPRHAFRVWRRELPTFDTGAWR
ncbi:MAG TPA: hypothetical protein VLA56_16555, partial [Pseudomonadales bacterium]|nr:hypothetical protein [Pseudomonadales bacterium]